MAGRFSDLVRDSQLQTTIAGNTTRHVLYATTAEQRVRTPFEETWERQKKLGVGGFSQVWLEQCVVGQSTGRLRAVKEITKENYKIDYSRELEAMAKFSHENYVHCFVKLLGWYEDPYSVFIAMEYVENGDLRQYVRDPLPEDDVRQIISQLLEGLVYMHDNGFTHRDLKPANILVMKPGPQWWVKIGDFGISKRAESGETALRTKIGTADFLAPEVIGIVSEEDLISLSQHGSNTYTSAVDIWALGQVAFVMLTSQTAFQNTMQLSTYILTRRGFPRSAMEKYNISMPCSNFVESLMNPSPRLRPTALEASIKPWLNNKEAKARSLRSLRASDWAMSPTQSNMPQSGTNGNDQEIQAVQEQKDSVKFKSLYIEGEARIEELSKLAEERQKEIAELKMQLDERIQPMDIKVSTEAEKNDFADLLQKYKAVKKFYFEGRMQKDELEKQASEQQNQITELQKQLDERAAPVNGLDSTDIDDKAFKELLIKYRNVKRLYFDGKLQIETLEKQLQEHGISTSLQSPNASTSKLSLPIRSQVPTPEPFGDNRQDDAAATARWTTAGQSTVHLADETVLTPPPTEQSPFQSTQISLRVIEDYSFPEPHCVYTSPPSRADAQSAAAMMDYCILKNSDKWAIATRISDPLVSPGNTRVGSAVQRNLGIEPGDLVTLTGAATPRVIISARVSYLEGNYINGDMGIAVLYNDFLHPFLRGIRGIRRDFAGDPFKGEDGIPVKVGDTLTIRRSGDGQIANFRIRATNRNDEWTRTCGILISSSELLLEDQSGNLLRYPAAHITSSGGLARLM